MQINTNSWHYKIYEWSYNSFPWSVSYLKPAKTNLCQYTRRILVLTPLYTFLFGLLILFIALCYLVLIVSFNPIVIPFGYRVVIPYLIDKDYDGDLITPAITHYNGLMIKGKEIYPWHVLLPIAFVALNYWVVQSYGWILPLMVNGSILGIAAFAALWLYRRRFNSETVSLIQANLSARKQKICPMIEFVNPSEENQ